MSDLFSRLAERAIRETRPPPPTGFTVLDEQVIQSGESPNPRNRASAIARPGSPAEVVDRDQTAAHPATVPAPKAAESTPSERNDGTLTSDVPVAVAPFRPGQASPDSETPISAKRVHTTAAPTHPPTAPSEKRPAQAVPATAFTGKMALAQPVPNEPAWRAESALERARTDDEPAVHVHIGRLDVRANLEQRATPRTLEPAAKPEPDLSLSAYLRGERTEP